jgi:hypothetical protein
MMMKPLRLARPCFLLATVFLCSHCGVIPPELRTKREPTASLTPAQIKHQQQWLAQTDLSHAQWLLDRQKLFEFEKEGSSSRRQQAQQRLYQEQQRLAAQLLMHCQALPADSAPLLLTQCHHLLRKLPLADELIPQLQQLPKPKFSPAQPQIRHSPMPMETSPSPSANSDKPESNKTNDPLLMTNPSGNTPADVNELDVNKKAAIATPDLLLQCQQNAQRGKWVQVRQQLNQLHDRQDLTPATHKKIDAIELKLRQALEQMENRAERLYQDKKIADAQRIWLEILQIAPDKQGIRNKYQRAQTVLENIEVLRQQPNEIP